MSGANRGYMDKACALFADNLRRFSRRAAAAQRGGPPTRLLIRQRGEEAILQILERAVGHEERDVAGARVVQHRGEDVVVRIAGDRAAARARYRIRKLGGIEALTHLMHPVVIDMKKAESILAWACEKMDERYEFLRRAEVRNIQAYNKLGADEIYTRLRPEDDEERQRIPTYMPYIVIIADELAKIMMTAEKEAEQHIVRLAQLARAVGVHLILATQKPVVDVVTGLIKGNLPARIAFQVTNRSDSRVVLDEMGAGACSAMAICSF